MSARLDRSASVVLDGSGNGTASLQVPNGETWLVDLLGVLCSTQATPIPRAVIYRGAIVDANAIAGTYSGAQDNAAGSVVPFLPGETIVCRWTGGVAGATATLIVRGTVDGLGYR